MHQAQWKILPLITDCDNTVKHNILWTVSIWYVFIYWSVVPEFLSNAMPDLS